MYPEDVLTPRDIRGQAAYAKNMAYNQAQASVPIKASLGDRLNALVNQAAAINGQAESVRGRLFGYGPPSLVSGSNGNMRECAPDTIEETVDRLASQLETALSTIGFLNSRL